MRAPAQRLLVREGDSPYLLALLGRQIVEVLREAGHQVAFGDQQVDRQLNA